MKMQTLWLKSLALVLLFSAWTAGSVDAELINEGAKPTNAISRAKLVGLHEDRLNAMLSARRKLKAGVSTLFEVRELARDLRDVEVRMSSTPVERVAAFARHTSHAREFQGAVRSSSDRVIARKWLEDAEAVLLQEKRDLE
jgi:hypothetical protein